MIRPGANSTTFHGILEKLILNQPSSGFADLSNLSGDHTEKGSTRALDLETYLYSNSPKRKRLKQTRAGASVKTTSTALYESSSMF